MYGGGGVHRTVGLGRGSRRPGRGTRPRLLLRSYELRCAGAHPLALAPTVPAGATLDEVTASWTGYPGAAVLLPVGRSFDVIEVAEEAGRRALVRLERMGLPLGPVTATPDGRAQFFVAPGAAAGLPQLLYRMGWDDAGLDLRALGQGAYVTAPPPTSRGADR